MPTTPNDLLRRGAATAAERRIDSLNGPRRAIDARFDPQTVASRSTNIDFSKDGLAEEFDKPARSRVNPKTGFVSGSARDLRAAAQTAGGATPPPAGAGGAGGGANVPPAQPVGDTPDAPRRNVLGRAADTSRSILGNVGRTAGNVLKTVGGVAGRGGGFVFGARGAANNVLDIAKNGATAENTVDLGLNSALTVGSLLKNPRIAAAAGLVQAGKDFVLPGIANAVESFGRSRNSIANEGTLQQVLAENPNGRLAQFTQGGAAPATRVAPAATPAAAASSGSIPAAAPSVAAERFQPTVSLSGADAQRVRQGIDNGSISLASNERGGGFVTNSDGGVTQIRSAPVVAPQTQPARQLTPEEELLKIGTTARRASDRTAALAELVRSRNDAAKISAATNKAASDRQFEERKDARKLLDERFNALPFFTTNTKGEQIPDESKIRRFKQFVAVADPLTGEKPGKILEDVFRTDPQEADKVLQELLNQFELKENSGRQTLAPLRITSGARKTRFADDVINGNLPLTDFLRAAVVPNFLGGFEDSVVTATGGPDEQTALLTDRLVGDGQNKEDLRNTLNQQIRQTNGKTFIR